jgi:hypothetical protein
MILCDVSIDHVVAQLFETRNCMLISNDNLQDLKSSDEGYCTA